ncbi:hypothetical protein EKG83_24195 [Saccharothrix syringae]|uniref:Uncharacterized protein n=1 Tax=Saccharothrix syringae TaxID=103733 RepID=A0A5Q0H2G3_SACSY|nr:hypothetical protein EKG83_24195 [Saccharothrix syringae]
MLCAYLRMPYTLPGDPPADNADEPTRTRHDHRVQEREVRLTAQHILTTHLHPGPNPDHPVKTYWPDTDLNLTGATLIDLDLDHCQPHHARFDRATFTVDAYCGGAITQHPVETSNWPTGWRATDDHQPVDGREGTWHRLVEIEVALVDSP